MSFSKHNVCGFCYLVKKFDIVFKNYKKILKFKALHVIFAKSEVMKGFFIFVTALKRLIIHVYINNIDARFVKRCLN
jgi:hypothetical protein